MSETRKFMKKHLTNEDLSNEDIIKGLRNWYVIHTDTGGYSENEVEFWMYIDGTLSIISDREYGVRLQPEQIDALRDFLTGKL